MTVFDHPMPPDESLTLLTRDERYWTRPVRGLALMCRRPAWQVRRHRLPVESWNGPE